MLNKCLNEFRGSDDSKWGWPGRAFREGEFKLGLIR